MLFLHSIGYATKNLIFKSRLFALQGRTSRITATS